MEPHTHCNQSSGSAKRLDSERMRRRPPPGGLRGFVRTPPLAKNTDLVVASAAHRRLPRPVIGPLQVWEGLEKTWFVSQLCCMLGAELELGLLGNGVKLFLSCGLPLCSHEGQEGSREKENIPCVAFVALSTAAVMSQARAR